MSWLLSAPQPSKCTRVMQTCYGFRARCRVLQPHQLPSASPIVRVVESCAFLYGTVRMALPACRAASLLRPRGWCVSTVTAAEVQQQHQQQVPLVQSCWSHGTATLPGLVAMPCCGAMRLWAAAKAARAHM
jgi:hypothetical protein